MNEREKDVVGWGVRESGRCHLFLSGVDEPGTDVVAWKKIRLIELGWNGAERGGSAWVLLFLQGRARTRCLCGVSGSVGARGLYLGFG